MNLKKQVAIYTTALMLATTPAPAYARNEFVFNFFKTITRTAVAPFAVTFSGLKNLYEQTEEQGVAGFTKNIGGVLGPVIPKSLEELTARVRQEDMNSPVGEKGKFYEAIEKSPVVQTLVDAIPMAITFGAAYNPLSIPFSYVARKITNFNSKDEGPLIYTGAINKAFTPEEFASQNPYGLRSSEFNYRSTKDGR